MVVGGGCRGEGAQCANLAPFARRVGSTSVQEAGSAVSALLSPQLVLRGRVVTRRDQRGSGAPAVIGPFPRGPAFVGAASPRAAGELRLFAPCDSRAVSRVLRG